MSEASDTKPPSNTKFLIMIGVFMALIMIALIIFSPSLVGVIVDTNQTANETKQETENQTEIIINQFQRENNTTQKIISNQGVVIDKLNQSLENQNLMIIQLNKTVVHNQKDIALNLNISKQHEQVSRDHDTIQNTTGNALYMYGENSVKELKDIKINQQKILEFLAYMNKTRNN